MSSGDNDRFGTREDAHVPRDEARVGGSMHESIFHDAFPGKSYPIVLDAEDGMPRPDDARVPGAAPPLSHETLVCLGDDRTWVEIFNDDADQGPDVCRSGVRVTFRHGWDEAGAAVERRSYPASEVQHRWGAHLVRLPEDDPRYLKGEEQWIAVRPLRPVCAHYTEQLVLADDIEGPGGAPVKPIHRFCREWRTLSGALWSIGDEAIYACLSRSPRDLLSEARLTERRNKKMQEGRDRVDTILVPPLGGTVDVDEEIGRLASMEARGREYIVQPAKGTPSDACGHLFLLSAGPDPTWSHREDMSFAPHPPHFLVLPEPGFQPPDALYENKHLGLRAPGANDHMINAPNTGRAILRLLVSEPAYTTDADAETWPAFESRLLALALTRNAEACAKALRDGKHVWIVGREIEAQCAFFAALVFYHVSLLEAAERGASLRSGLDCLDDLASDVVDEVGTVGELATNFTHRVYLRNLRGAP